jgi:hemerythrin-like metal-binding protein
LKWSIKYATGVERIDTQHKRLFQMSEDFRAALDEGRAARVYRMLLDSLTGYARAHFGIEEECMEQCRCPAAEENTLAHVKFVEVLGGFHKRNAERGFDQAEAQRLVDFVDQWLADHIGRIDVRLKPCVEDSQP